MKMTDEKFIEFLRKIKEHCASLTYPCEGCKFKASSEETECQITQLLDTLQEPPCDWNMDEIERIIRL